MSTELKNKFPPFLNEDSLRSAIKIVCAEFGKVMFLEIVLPARASGMETLQCICLLRLDSAASEAALMSKLELVKVGSYLVFFADVDERWVGTTLQ